MTGGYNGFKDLVHEIAVIQYRKMVGGYNISQFIRVEGASYSIGRWLVAITLCFLRFFLHRSYSIGR